jgi:hypothetical protein
MTVRMVVVPFSGIASANEKTRNLGAFIRKLSECKFKAQLGAGELAIADVTIPMMVDLNCDTRTKRLSGSAKVKMKRDDYFEFASSPSFQTTAVD